MWTSTLSSKEEPGTHLDANHGSEQHNKRAKIELFTPTLELLTELSIDSPQRPMCEERPKQKAGAEAAREKIKHWKIAAELQEIFAIAPRAH